MHAALTLALTLQLGSTGGDLLLNTGDSAPPFSMRDLDRKMFSLRDHVGNAPTEARKAMVLVFFATWCKPCMKEIPILKSVHRRWQGKGVEIAYIGLSQGDKDLGPFAKQESLPWRVIPDGFGLLARRYGVSQLPHLFIVGADGNIAFQNRGISEDLKATIEQQLGRLTGATPAADDEALPAVIDRPRFDTTYTLARVPSSSAVVARWQPLAAYVGETLQANVTLHTESSYEAFAEALRHGKYDFANAGPMLCYELRAEYEPLVRLERQGTPTYLGVLFALRKSPIASLAALRGKTLGLVSSESTSGGLYPQLALLDAGLIPGKDVTLRWLGNHTKVAEAVRDGTVDAGGCYEGCLDPVWPSDADKAASTRLLAYTAEIPSEAIVARRSLDAKVKEAMRRALIATTREAGILGQISEGEKSVTAIVAASDADLAAVGRAMARLREATGQGR